MMINESGVYILGGVRTPIGSYGGALSFIRPDDMAAHVIKKLTESMPAIKTESIEQVVLGCANQAGEDNRNIARMALLLADLPKEVSGITLNRLCASGLDAVIYAYSAIKSGINDIVIAGGVESMSRSPFVFSKSSTPFQNNIQTYDTTIGWRFINKKMESLYGCELLGLTAEKVAKENNISREEQDLFAYQSQIRAKKAIESGRMAKEICSIDVPVDRKNMTKFEVDEHPRNITFDKLSGLKPAFQADGSVTAGNSTGLNDGAAALLIVSGRKVKELGLMPIAEIKQSTSCGVHPARMGLGPIASTQKLLSKTGFSFQDFDILELNEAFSAQVLACLKHWDIAYDDQRVNRNGGAIALGHPLGMSGARLVLTAAMELHTTDCKRALISMCVGVGQGVSLILESI